MAGMAASLLLSVFLVLCAGTTVSLSLQAPILAANVHEASSTQAAFSPSRKLHGRFLHITDLHPDPFYKVYGSPEGDAACHRSSGSAGVYGAENTDCDSPTALINATFSWIDENLKDSIDFVVWTGDSARHDNDEKIPRTEQQVLDQNQYVTDKFVEIFGKKDKTDDTDPGSYMLTPVIPTFGNNDVMPHNVLSGGPNKWTRQFAKMWHKFIPEEQRHGFERGGWFYVEVIPNRLAVFSLNTMYFFDSNAAVDGCGQKSEPGYEHFEWLRVQLNFLRQRGMKAILTGHVPPARTESKQSWDESCWQKYTLWLRQYRDVVVGSVYGHMNIDHFMIQDSNDIDILAMEQESVHESVGRNDQDKHGQDKVTLQSATTYLTELRDVWSKLPRPPASLLEMSTKDAAEPWSTTLETDKSVTKKNKKKKNKHKKGRKGKEAKYYKKIGGKFGERYILAHVSSSVVPNYFPTLRVIEYNISSVDDHVLGVAPLLQQSVDPLVAPPIPSDYAAPLERPSTEKKKKHKGKKDKHKKKKRPSFEIPDAPSKSSPPGPAYSAQPFTWLGYHQYFANLTRINNDLDSQIDESSPELKSLSYQKRLKRAILDVLPSKKHSKPHPKKFKYEIEYSTFDDKIFGLKDMTVTSYLELARRISSSTGKKSSELVTGSADVEHERIDGDDIEQGEGGDFGSAVMVNGKKKKHGHSENPVWFTFLRRAFTGAKDDDDIHEDFD
ncbi:MAG: hypothetical protein M1825_003821 [Sarcosagium campestre]|nr:MAG: hypothetical protein M1825_003821 [Sarcosagium campestre]